MSQDREWSYNYYCLTCKKYLSEDFYHSHKSFGHSAERYISMPKNSEKSIKAEDEIVVIEQTIKNDDKHHIFRPNDDLADIEENEPELEFEG